ncbi:hypothetical protein JCGZ_19835 [Jatropha curcas]|uniref:PB1-like domain-containing protein n=1 Tax=Jatropha curcas TaxID=180498 RepID=A0A067JV27_JATCU|nr:hypothetical protein JCGZ_19835 [Jatropha curcas]
MVEKQINIRWVHRGTMVYEPHVRYIGGIEFLEEEVDIDRCSYFELVGKAEDFGYQNIAKVYHRWFITGETEVFSSLYNDEDVMFALNFIPDGGTIEVYVEHGIELAEVVEVDAKVAGTSRQEFGAGSHNTNKGVSDSSSEGESEAEYIPTKVEESSSSSDEDYEGDGDGERVGSDEGSDVNEKLISTREGLGNANGGVRFGSGNAVGCVGRGGHTAATVVVRGGHIVTGFVSRGIGNNSAGVGRRGSNNNAGVGNGGGNASVGLGRGRGNASGSARGRGRTSSNVQPPTLGRKRYVDKGDLLEWGVFINESIGLTKF